MLNELCSQIHSFDYEISIKIQNYLQYIYISKYMVHTVYMRQRFLLSQGPQFACQLTDDDKLCLGHQVEIDV